MHGIAVVESDGRFGLVAQSQIELAHHVATCAGTLLTRLTTIHGSHTTILSIHAECHVRIHVRISFWNQPALEARIPVWFPIIRTEEDILINGICLVVSSIALTVTIRIVRRAIHYRTRTAADVVIAIARIPFLADTCSERLGRWESLARLIILVSQEEPLVIAQEREVVLCQIELIRFTINDTTRSFHAEGYLIITGKRQLNIQSLLRLTSHRSYPKRSGIRNLGFQLHDVTLDGNRISLTLHQIFWRVCLLAKSEIFWRARCQQEDCHGNKKRIYKIMYFHIFLLLNVYYITYPALPSGILSKNVTGKRNLSIRNLHQTLLAGKVVNSKLGCSLHSTILYLGTILSLGNLLCSV